MSPHALCRAPRGAPYVYILPRASASASARSRSYTSLFCVSLFSSLSGPSWRLARDRRHRSRLVRN